MDLRENVRFEFSEQIVYQLTIVKVNIPLIKQKNFEFLNFFDFHIL